MDNLAAVLELEKLDFVAKMNDSSAALRKEIEAIKAKHAAQGILHSGNTLSKIAEARTGRCKELLEFRFQLRRKYGASHPELFTDGELNRLADECTQVVDGLAKALQMNADLPGIVGAIPESPYVDPLRAMVQREIRKLKLERTLGMTEPVKGNIVVNISNSVVSGLNLGSIVGEMNTTVHKLEQSGNPDIAEALKALAEGFAADAELDKKRRDVLEVLTTLGEQANLPTHQRKLGVVRASIEYINTVVGLTVNSLVLWTTYGPHLQKFFGLG